MRVFDYDDYRLFLKDWIAARPKSGRGILGQWATQLRVHSTHLSHVLAGKKDLSIETAHELAELIGLTDAEQDHFILLVLYARAGTASLKARLKKKIEKSRDQANKVQARVKVTAEIPSEAKAIFYSSWVYSGIKNLLALGKYQTVDEIASTLGISREVAKNAIEFMIEYGICERQNGYLVPGKSRTHVGHNSPFVKQHLFNWRNVALQRLSHSLEDGVHFSFPMNLSEKDAERIREEVLKLIETVNRIVAPSPPETVRCLNIDLFSFLQPSSTDEK